MSQRETLVDHDELADLQDEPPVYGVGGNHDGQPSPILQIQDVETRIDTREQSAPPTPEVDAGGTPFQQPQSKGPSQNSPVLFINDRQTQLDVGNTPVAQPGSNLPRVVVTQPSTNGLTHPSTTVVQPPVPPTELRRSLKAKDILFLQVFASVVCICFPFTGVIALLHSCNTQKYFEEGKFDLAQKFASKAERFILCTIILGFLFLVILIAIVEAAVNKRPPGWNQWPHGAAMVG